MNAIKFFYILFFIAMLDPEIYWFWKRQIHFYIKKKSNCTDSMYHLKITWHIKKNFDIINKYKFPYINNSY